MPRYWLMKSEPESYSIEDLERDGSTAWEGVRNYQARNFLRDDIRPGDGVLFYHSSARPPGVAGVASVVKGGYADATARDPEGDYFDEKATDEDSRWFAVDIRFEERFAEIVPIASIREVPELQEMLLVNKSRLSIQPLTEREFEIIGAMGRG